MTFAFMQSEGLRQLILQILREGVAAAQQPGAPATVLPLAPLYIPKHRFEKLDPKRAPFLHVVAKSDGGAGQSHELPRIDGRASIHVNLLCACGRDDAADLDNQAGQLAEAVAVRILEDQRFLKAIRWVDACRATNEDGVMRGESGGGEYDVVLIQIEIEVAVGPVRFDPRDDGVPLTTVSIGAELEPNGAPLPDQGLTVTVQFPIDQSD